MSDSSPDAQAVVSPSVVPRDAAHQTASFAALQYRHFVSYFIGTMLAMMADNIEHVITYWVLFQKFHSSVLAGFAVISHWTPFLLLSVYCGSLADRYDCRKLIQGAQITYMLVSAAWAWLFFTDSLQVWHACVLLVIHGLAGVFWGPAEQLMIHDIVGPTHLASAVRLNATSRQLGILFGPAVGGGLMLWLGPSAGLVVNMLIYLPLTIWLLKAPYTGHTRDGAVSRRAMRWRDALALVGEVAKNRPIISMIVLGGAASFLVGNAFQATMPEFAHDLGGGENGDWSYSALLAASAAGSVLGGMLLEGKGWLDPTPRAAFMCAAAWCVAMAGFAFSTNYLLALVLLFVAGGLNLAFYSIAQTIVQLRATPQLRGRLIGLFAMSAFGLRAFSGVTVGVIGGLIGIHWSLALSAMVLFAVIAVLFSFASPVKSATA